MNLKKKFPFVKIIFNFSFIEKKLQSFKIFSSSFFFLFIWKKLNIFFVNFQFYEKVKKIVSFFSLISFSTFFSFHFHSKIANTIDGNVSFTINRSNDFVNYQSVSVQLCDCVCVFLCVCVVFSSLFRISVFWYEWIIIITADRQLFRIKISFVFWVCLLCVFLFFLFFLICFQ